MYVFKEEKKKKKKLIPLEDEDEKIDSIKTVSIVEQNVTQILANRNEYLEQKRKQMEEDRKRRKLEEEEQRRKDEEQQRKEEAERIIRESIKELKDDCVILLDHQDNGDVEEIIVDDDDAEVPSEKHQESTPEVELIPVNSEGDIEIEESQMEEPSNQQIRILVKRLNRFEMFPMLRTDPLSTVFENIGQRFDIPVPKIILYLKDKIVDIKSTPESLQLTERDVFNVFCRGSTVSTAAHDPNNIEIVVRDKSKHSKRFTLNRLEPVKRIAELYMENTKIPEETLNSIRIIFEGQKMKLDDRIEDYDLENDDQIDILV